MAHTVIPPLRCTAATLELAHKGNINDKTITERDREVLRPNEEITKATNCGQFMAFVGTELLTPLAEAAQPNQSCMFPYW